MNWKVGDRAIIVHDRPLNNVWAVGLYCTIESMTTQASAANRVSIVIDGHPEASYGSWSVHVGNLRPIPDDFTRYHNELAEKGPCVWEWRPKVTVS